MIDTLNIAIKTMTTIDQHIFIIRSKKLSQASAKTKYGLNTRKFLAIHGDKALLAHV